MRLVTYLESQEQLSTLIEAGVNEAIIGVSNLSRFGKLSAAMACELAKACRENDIRPVLEWDVLMTENVFNMTIKSFDYIDLSLFDAIRLQDPGAVNYVLEKFPQMPIQMILEAGGHHNIEAVKIWQSLIGDKLERVILSLELSKDTLEQYIKELDVEVELLGLGRILLFYTPRSLVTPVFGTEKETLELNQSTIEVSASSEESPHKGFPVIENMHGTFMFNTKDIYLLEYLDELFDVGLQNLRIDLRFGHDLGFLKRIRSLMGSFSKDVATQIKNDYPNTTIRGFFHVNKSDVLFKKLKNYRIQRSDMNFLGDVIEVNKKKHIGIMLRSRQNELKVGDTLKLYTPDGKEKVTKVNVIKTSAHEEIENAGHGQVVFIPHISGISVKTTVYKD
ncbi:U32 family peptidase C-terminal domain-containing protein [Bacteriovorax sp. DB6_IX]|uniref:U32 family peptidase C-terminal domain-containing protein n=1 Tax=Bacteriovorax sp. DB6_IX TaxID=1353530 RepID=UPI00038A358B|nr:U32 family peptidase C-terminal domain-containing protein [Bacteriovorax sp. DB6_IX]EQC44126.1 peptidase, U32 family [Bacteriovorax sp. DB6_IX]